MPRIARRVRLDFFLRRRESPHFAPRAASPRSRGARRSPRGAASRARASRMRVSSRALAPRDTARGARARRKRVGGGAVRAVSRSTARENRREELVCYWDLDNMRPPCGVEALWAARIVEASKSFAKKCVVRAYANKTTLSAPRLRERLTRAGVDIVEVSDVSQAADERLMSDVYVRARDANDAGVANELATMVMTCDARLSICVEQSRVRGLLTIALSDYLRTWRSRPEFRHLFQKFAKVHALYDASSYERALQTIARNGKMFSQSKLAKSADVALVWDPRRVMTVTPAELKVHNRVHERGDDDFGSPVAAPGGVVGTLLDGAIVVWA